MGMVRVILGCVVFAMPALFVSAQEPVVLAAHRPLLEEATDPAPVAVSDLAENAVAGACCTNCCQARCCCPGWSVTKDTMFLRRRNASSSTLVTNQVTGAPMLTTRDFDDDYDVIPRLQIIHQDCCCNGWELNMFGLAPLDTTNFSGDPDSPFYLAPGIGIGSTAPGTVFRTEYETDLHSIELNHRRFQSQCLTWVAGFRWLELGDTLSVSQVAPIRRDLFTIDTDNHMVGFQVGLDAILWQATNRFRVESSLRTAILHNSADMTLDAPFLAGVPNTASQQAARADHTAFFAELNFQAVYQVSSRLAARAGYQFMWLEGVAVGPDQIAANSLIGSGLSAVDTSGSLYLSGFSVGGTLRF